MNNFLVIGGTGVMGTAAIKAIREKFGDNANIMANWYGKEEPGFNIEGVNETLFGDINDPQVLEKIKAFNNGQFDTLFYATALGEVGVPISEATLESIALSNKLSFDPILKLESELDVKTIVAYSTLAGRTGSPSIASESCSPRRRDSP